MKRSIAVRISVYVGLLVIVFCGGLGVISYFRGASAVTTQVENALLMQAEQAVEYLESRFDAHFSILETLAARPDIQSMNWQLQQGILQNELARLGDYEALAVVYPDGSAMHHDGTVVNVGDRDYVQRAFSGQRSVSDLNVNRATETLVLGLTVPIKQGNKVVGVLMARLDGGAISEITDGLGFGDHGWAYVISSDGTVLAHPDRDYVFEQRNIFTYDGLRAVGEAIRELDSGHGIVRFEIDGTRRINGLAQVPQTGWTVGIGAVEGEILEDVNQLRSFLFVISVLFIAAGIFIAVLVSRQISKPLQNVQYVIEEVAKGNLTQKAQIASADEVGAVAQALNRTLDSMLNVLGGTARATAAVTETSEELAAASQEVSASIEEVASTTNQFSSTIDTMNTHAQAFDDKVQGISREVSHGSQALEEMMAQIKLVLDNTQRLASDMSDLGTLSEEIGGIAQMIAGIADQTNLLALNAAIEAARAGEHGRGFAVVAEEVRKLAEQAAQATAEIDALLTQVQGGISGAVKDMNDGAQQAERAVARAQESGVVLNNILKDVDEITMQVSEFVRGLAEINAGGQEIASAAEEQAAAIEQIASAAQRLTDLALEVATLIEHFTLAD